ncbi:integrase/recombinase xerD homolog [Ranitomeya imitator]|uniref:integrase/recombinase xerD homolog n=1 Tax=Ranitomeya imitator TaxID=111125 RepID=UPI0037E7AF31
MSGSGETPPAHWLLLLQRAELEVPVLQLGGRGGGEAECRPGGDRCEEGGRESPATGEGERRGEHELGHSSRRRRASAGFEPGYVGLMDTGDAAVESGWLHTTSTSMGQHEDGRSTRPERSHQDAGLAAAGNTAPRQPVGSCSGVGTSSGTHREGLFRGAMESSAGAVRDLLARSLSAGTWSHYMRAWDSWVRWKYQMGVDLEDGSKLILFIGHIWETGWSVSKINNSLSGLAFGFKLRGFTGLTKSFLVRQVVKGCRKGWKVSDGRHPVSYEVLLNLENQLEAVCSDMGEVILFRLAFSLAFFGAFRLGELVSPSRYKKGGILRQDVDMFGDRLVIFLRSSKTDTAGKGCRVVLFEVNSSPVCPVKCLREFLSGPGLGDCPLLVPKDGSFLSRFQFLTVFRRCLEKGGIPAKNFSGHSFRIGAATEAARRGLGDEMVQRIGRWESVRFRSYICPSLL